MADKTLSVITPNYNDSKLIGDLLTTVCEQSFLPKEVIVVDDGSTDNSIEVIEAFAIKYPLIRLVQNDRNRGIAYSVNRGVGLATGDYLYVVSANDYILPGFFEKSMGLLAQFPHAGLSCANPRVFDVKRRLHYDVSAKWLSSPGYICPERLAEITRTLAYTKDGLIQPHTSTCITRRDLMPRDGVYFPQLGFAADWFVNQVIAFRHGLCFIPEPLAVWRDTGAGFAYAVIDSPDRQPLRDVFMETLKLLSLPEYEDVTELMIRGCSLHIFPTDIRTPIMAFKALRDLQAKNNQVDALFMHLVAEYVGELLDCNVHRLHSAENVLRRMTETATLSTEVYGGAGVVASEGKSDAPGMDDACNDPSKRKFSWAQDEISQRLADAARRLAALESLEEELRDLKGVAAALETEKDVLIDQGRKLHERLARYQNSASWTITKPLRFAARALTGRR